jgi:Electron transfer DM13
VIAITPQARGRINSTIVALQRRRLHRVVNQLECSVGEDVMKSPNRLTILMALAPVLLSACAGMTRGEFTIAGMEPLQVILLVVTHVLTAAVGFAAGIYVLPILTAPPSPSVAEVTAHAAQATFTGQFRRDLKGRDRLHWGEGTVSVGPASITFMGKLAPGPAYKLYLSPEFVETEADFARLKSLMIRVGDVNTFDTFVIPLPETVDVTQYNTVIVWCESFSQFITAARYR